MLTILVTGAARGIGRELVDRAAARGDTVIAAVRKESDRSHFASSPTVHVVLMDVADSASVESGFAQADQLLAGRKLDIIVNCAAVAGPGAIEVAPFEDFERTLGTNTLGSLRLLRAGIPRIRGRGGKIVLVTSLWGKAAGPLLGAYCASKHAIEALADVARRETAGMNVHIVLVEPGVVKTEMLTQQPAECEALITRMSPVENSLYGSLYRRYAKLTEGAARTAITAAQCAAEIEAIFRARSPRTRYRIGRDSTIVCFLTWLLPDRWMDKLLALSLNHKPLPAAK